MRAAELVQSTWAAACRTLSELVASVCLCRGGSLDCVGVWHPTLSVSPIAGGADMVDARIAKAVVGRPRERGRLFRRGRIVGGRVGARGCCQFDGATLGPQRELSEQDRVALSHAVGWSDCFGATSYSHCDFRVGICDASPERHRTVMGRRSRPWSTVPWQLRKVDLEVGGASAIGKGWWAVEKEAGHEASASCGFYIYRPPLSRAGFRAATAVTARSERVHSTDLRRHPRGTMAGFGRATPTSGCPEPELALRQANNAGQPEANEPKPAPPA